MPTSHSRPPTDSPPDRGHEMDSETGLVIPSLGRTLRLFGRALTLRCPNCGKGPVLQHWLKLRLKCGTCGLRLQRGEHDTFVGAMFILFTMIGLTSYAIIAITAAVMKATPWDFLQNWLPVIAIVELLFYFPFAKLTWLAFDLMLRPVTASELEWHRSAAAEFETERDAPGR